jgi:hypothetical protein
MTNLFHDLLAEARKPWFRWVVFLFLAVGLAAVVLTWGEQG